MDIRRIGATQAEPLYSVEATRAIESARASTLPPFELMARAGASVARLARAIAPHARRIWIACGPGNNGGDGLVAARHLLSNTQGQAQELVVTLTGQADRLPSDAARALVEARASGLVIAERPPERADLVIDALLGIGAHSPPRGEIAEQLRHMHTCGAPVLSVDVPSGLLADTGCYLGPTPPPRAVARHTLSLLTLKPGLFTADGRDLAGTVWFDALGETPPGPATALLHGQPTQIDTHHRPHTEHKGSRGDVVVIGGQDPRHGGAGMTGAAILAARTALHVGAGRVYVGLLGNEGDIGWDPMNPELMFRHSTLLTGDRPLLKQSAVVCGCGGGTLVADVLPDILSHSPSLVLDADALNRIAEDSELRGLLRRRGAHQVVTVITPHPLEAARLLGCNTAEVMADRLRAAIELSNALNVICVLKGSGTVVTAPGKTPSINSSGNPALATAGTGDVLAGWIGATLAYALRHPDETDAVSAVLSAVHAHGACADQWVATQPGPLTAGRLASAAGSSWARR
ncbi:MAG: NAD(P)H-hydrate dehydratase [Hydrogenophaga sp.]|nr:NAD(P)H-hydrate dehydratase [Hydrogenophaga sp.]